MMKILIVEDDFGSRRYLQKLLSSYGDCDVVVDGDEAIHAFRMAWDEGSPYDVIFLDIMLPKVDGQEALKRIRKHEREMGIKMLDEVKVIMTTGLGDPKTVIEAYHHGGATSYLVKPLDKEKILRELENLGLLTI